MTDLAVDDEGRLKADDEDDNVLVCWGCKEERLFFGKKKPRNFCQRCRLYAQNHQVSTDSLIDAAKQFENVVYLSIQSTSDCHMWRGEMRHGGVRLTYKTPVVLKDGKAAYFVYLEYRAEDDWAGWDHRHLFRDKLKAEGVEVVE